MHRDPWAVVACALRSLLVPPFLLWIVGRQSEFGTREALSGKVAAASEMRGSESEGGGGSGNQKMDVKMFIR